MARPSNTEERRRAIVDAMLDVVAAQGYEGASTKDIAAAAGLTTGLLHYHFDSKQAMLVALFDRLVAEVDGRFSVLAVHAGSSAMGQLEAFIDAHLALGPGANARAVAAWVAVGAEAQRNAEVRTLFAAVTKARLETLRELYRAVLAEAELDTRHARSMAAVTLAAIEGAYRLAASAPDAMPKGFAAPAVRRMVEGLIGTARAQ